jgi:hypothetical protein
MYYQEGFKSYFKAIHIRTLTIASMGIVFFNSYEFFKYNISTIVDN